jgi:hypothetical protein
MQWQWSAQIMNLYGYFVKKAVLEALWPSRVVMVDYTVAYGYVPLRYDWITCPERVSPIRDTSRTT